MKFANLLIILLLVNLIVISFERRNKAHKNSKAKRASNHKLNKFNASSKFLY